MAGSMLSGGFTVQTAAESYKRFVTYNKATAKPAKPTMAAGTDNGWAPANYDGAVWMCEKSALTIAEGTWGEVIRFKGEDGATGARGMLPFPAGEYSASKTYVATVNTAPFVLLAGTYYVMNKPGSWLGTSTGKTPAQDYVTDGVNATWIPFENFRAIYAELLFARFGLLGAAVFYDDYMFSQYGTNAAGTETSDYSGFATGTFKPYFKVNLSTGVLEATRGVFWGDVKVPFKHIGASDATSLGLLRYKLNTDLKLITEPGGSVVLPAGIAYNGCQVILANNARGVGRVDWNTYVSVENNGLLGGLSKASGLGDLLPAASVAFYDGVLELLAVPESETNVRWMVQSYPPNAVPTY